MVGIIIFYIVSITGNFEFMHSGNACLCIGKEKEGEGIAVDNPVSTSDIEGT